ncbi:TolC family protein [Dyella sp.]|uniref:TolC family protein n=1 Tax=Dyella sp. TaxID=1869338 RepID=UPI002ED0B6A2
MKRSFTRLLSLSWMAVLAGCATYRPMPLPDQPPAPASFSTEGPLSLADIDRRVLLSDPELVSVRAQRRVARAQLLQAGLLPNPVVGGNLGYLMSGTGDATAWTASISQDVQALVTWRPRHEAARAQAEQVDASLLWQEWQTLGKAHLLAVDISEGQRELSVRQAMLALSQALDAKLGDSLAQGDVELAVAGTSRAATRDAQATVDDLRRQLLSQRRQLAAMMGLAPDTVLWLRMSTQGDAHDCSGVDGQLERLQDRRPDLVALQLGYHAQEAQLRAAVLAQFPTLSFGVAEAQDNSRVRNGGPSISLSLPLFDRNQGHVAIERATRQQLYDEYVARLRQARDEVALLRSQCMLARAQRDALEPERLQARQQADTALAAWQAGLLDRRAYVDLMTTATAREIAAIALDRTMLEQHAALETLLGSGMPETLPEMAEIP